MKSTTRHRVGARPEYVADLPPAPGVYRFRDERGRILYVGRATNLRRRVASYQGPLQGRAHLTRMVVQIRRVEAVQCDSLHEAAWLERLLMQRSRPRWNRTVGGQEVPVFVRLNRSERSPGLSLVHEAPAGPALQYFGPYLGGNKVRIALNGLHRLLPLALAGSGQSGSVREMARLRSVNAAQRELLIDGTVAVLERDCDAVDAASLRLVKLRDAASAHLNFERAAVLQAEWEAVQWLVAPQRVMVPGGGDHTFTGWADGFAVDFRMTAGMVDGWRVRASSRTAAATRLAATPVSWRSFADRAAALAASTANRSGGS